MPRVVDPAIYHRHYEQILTAIKVLQHSARNNPKAPPISERRIFKQAGVNTQSFHNILDYLGSKLDADRLEDLKKAFMEAGVDFHAIAVTVDYVRAQTKLGAKPKPSFPDKQPGSQQPKGEAMGIAPGSKPPFGESVPEMSEPELMIPEEPERQIESWADLVKDPAPEPVVLPSSKKPPLGLSPRWVWIEHRIVEVCEAIRRYNEGGKAVPEEWIGELEWLYGEHVRALREFRLRVDN